MNNEEKEIIEGYFNDPTVQALMREELGPTGKITIDWHSRIIRAQSVAGGKQWDFDDILEAFAKPKGD